MPFQSSQRSLTAPDVFNLLIDQGLIKSTRLQSTEWVRNILITFHARFNEHSSIW
jgi:hypothetical protein